MIGLDAAGKTTILYKLHLGEIVSTYPTIGSNVEEVSYKNMRFQVWDLGGQDMLRQTWKTYFINTHALIMVVDSADVERLDTARKELHHILESEDLRNSCVLVFANKQDLKNALTAAELSEALALHSITTHNWHIQVRFHFCVFRTVKIRRLPYLTVILSTHALPLHRLAVRRKEKA